MTLLTRRSVAGTAVGVAMVAASWVAARFELCGLSGCGGGGFGRSYSPQTVIALLLLSGAGAAAVLLRFSRSARSRRVLSAASALLVLVPIAGAAVVGARPDGYPRSVSPETLELELERKRELERARDRQR